MKHLIHFTVLCTLFLALPLTVWAQTEDAPTAGPRKATRYNVLLKAKYLTVNTAQPKKKYYYMVSSEDNPMVRFLPDDIIGIGPDQFARNNIQAMRFESIPRLFLNEDSTTHGVDYAVENALLVLRRSFRVGGWNTLVLPVNLTGAQVREMFGDDTQLARVRGAEGEDELTIEFDTIDLNADEYALSANVCYLIRPTRNPDVEANRYVTGVLPTRLKGPLYMLPNVTLNTKQTPTLSYIRTPDKTLVARMRGTYTRLDNTELNARGSIVNKKLLAGTWSFNDEGYIVENTDSTLLQAFRCWIQNVDETKKLRFVINGVEDDLNGTPTGIITALVGTRTAGGNVFDLQGRHVATLQNDERIESLGLPRGIYLINGKKVFIQ